MSEDAPAPPGDWSDRVAFSGSTNRFAYNPHQIVVAGEHGKEVALRLFGGILTEVDASTSVDSTTSVPRVFTLFRVRDGIDPLAVIRQLRTEGVVAQPNHILFAHGD